MADLTKELVFDGIKRWKKNIRFLVSKQA